MGDIATITLTTNIYIYIYTQTVYMCSLRGGGGGGRVFVYSFHDDERVYKVLSYSASVEHEVRGSLKLDKKPLLYSRAGRPLLGAAPSLYTVRAFFPRIGCV